MAPPPKTKRSTRKVDPDGVVWVPASDPIVTGSSPPPEPDRSRGRKSQKKVHKTKAIIIGSSDVDEPVGTRGPAPAVGVKVENNDDARIPAGSKGKGSARREKGVDAAALFDSEDEEEVTPKVVHAATQRVVTSTASDVEEDEDETVVAQAYRFALKRAREATVKQARVPESEQRPGFHAIRKETGGEGRSKDTDKADEPPVSKKSGSKRKTNAGGRESEYPEKEVRGVPKNAPTNNKRKPDENTEDDEHHVSHKKPMGKIRKNAPPQEPEDVDEVARPVSKKSKVQRNGAANNDKQDPEDDRRPLPKSSSSLKGKQNATVRDQDNVNPTTPARPQSKGVLQPPPPPKKKKVFAPVPSEPQRTSSMDVQKHDSPCPSSPYRVDDDDDEDEEEDEEEPEEPKEKKRKRRRSPKPPKSKASVVEIKEAERGSEDEPEEPKKKRKTSTSGSKAPKVQKDEMQIMVPPVKVLSKLEELDVTETLRRNLEAQPAAKLKPLLQEVKGAYLGMALVDISCGDEETSDGYILTTAGANKREATRAGVAKIYASTHEGVSIFNNLEGYALTLAAKGSQLDKDSLTTDASQTFVPLRVLFTHVLLMLLNGSHRRKMAVDCVITPAEKAIKEAVKAMAVCSDGSEAEGRFSDEVEAQERRIESCRYWVVKVYDSEVISASPNAAELMATLSTNLQPVTVEEQDSNKLWMIADSVHTLPQDASMEEIAVKVGAQTEVYVEAPPSGSKLRAITTNPYMMKAFAPLARIAHFRKSAGTSHFTSLDRLRPISLHTDVCFLAVCEASFTRLEFFGSDILGKAKSVIDYEQMDHDDRCNYLEELVHDFGDSDATPLTIPFNVLELLDKSFIKTMRKDFVELYGADRGSKKQAKWSSLVRAYIADALASLDPKEAHDPFVQTMEKRLYYMMRTRLASYFETVYHDTPMPIFTRDVLLGWTIFCGQPIPKNSDSWKSFELLAGAVAGMAEFRGFKRAATGPSSFQYLVANVKDPLHAGYDITTGLTNLFISEHTKGWRSGYTQILDDVATYKETTEFPLQNHLPLLERFYCAPSAEVRAYHDELADILAPYMVDHDEEDIERPIIEVSAVCRKHAGHISADFRKRLFKVLVMLNNSSTEWFRYAPTKTTQKKQRVRLVLDIHNMAGVEEMLRTLSEDVVFDEFRQALLTMYDGMDFRSSEKMSQWDDIPNVLREADDLPKESHNPPPSGKDAMQLFKAVDKRLVGVLSLPGVIGVMQDGVKSFEEGVVAAANALRCIYLAQAKMAAISKDPDFNHEDLDIVWAEQELTRAGLLKLPSVCPTDADSFFDDFADTLREDSDDNMASDRSGMLNPKREDISPSPGLIQTDLSDEEDDGDEVQINRASLDLVPTEPTTPASEHFRSDQPNFENGLLLVGLQALYSGLNAWVFMGTRTDLKLRKADRDLRWVEDRLHRFTPEHILHSKIFKVMYRIARLDDDELPHAHRGIIERARYIYMSWSEVMKFEPKMVKAPLTPPSASQRSSGDVDDLDVTGWNFDLSDQLTQEKA